MKAKPIKNRILERLTKCEHTGCLIWTGYRTKRNVAKINISNVPIAVSRLAYQAFIGPVPPKAIILKTCKNKLCFKKEHMYLGTRKEISYSPNKQKKQTKCLRGHEYNQENTYFNKFGHRKCKVCRRIREDDFKKKYGFSYSTLWKFVRAQGKRTQSLGVKSDD